MQSQLYENHGQFVEASIPDIEEALAFLDVSAPIPDIEEAFAFPDVSAPTTCTLSLAEITGNLSKISCEVEST
ncbi:hypothetical protein ACFX2C_019340 [Malus domestica]